MDHDRFPSLRTALEVIDQGGGSGAVFNAANEIAVQAFLDGGIGFGRIMDLVRQTLDEVEASEPNSLADVLETDALARERTRDMLASMGT